MEGKLIKQEKEYYALYTNKGIFISDVNGGSLANRLSLKNCQAIANGYDLDELVEDNFKGLRACIEDQDIAEFYISLVKTTITEILGDKKFSEEDLKKSWSEGYHRKVDELNGNGLRYFDKFIRTLQQTEWDVEVEMECVMGCQNLILNGENSVCCGDKKPKLDADGCLILKIK